MKPVAYILGGLLILFACFFFGILLLPLLAAFGIVWMLGALLTRWIHRKP